MSGRDDDPGERGQAAAAIVVVAARAAASMSPHCATCPATEMSPATAAAMVAISMSRFLTCDSSCASTASSSRSLRI